MLERLFSEIDLAKVQRFVAERKEESLNLDFKLASPLLTRDDRRNLAVALSGFANSAGGVLVWGVETKRDSPRSPDTAFALKPIAPLDQFTDLLRSLTLSAASPPLPAVEHKSIESSDNKGFAATLVLPSDAGPHMAKLGVDRYYKRNGDTFLRMEHFELEDIFGRRPRPSLEVYYRIEADGSVDNMPQARILVGIRNEGRGAAHHLFLELRAKPPLTASHGGIDGNYSCGLARLPSSQGLLAERFGAHGQVVLFPQMDLDVTAFRIPADRSLFLHDALIIEYSIAADGLPLKSDRISIAPSSLLGLR